MRWEFLRKVGAYSVWFFVDEDNTPFYQVTKGTMPDCFSGYKTLLSLAKLKGLQL